MRRKLLDEPCRMSATMPQSPRIRRSAVGRAEEILGIHVASATTYDIDWYRLGWYGGEGGRLSGPTRLPGGPSAPAAVTARSGWPKRRGHGR
jgi:hypothetical protein